MRPSTGIRKSEWYNSHFDPPGPVSAAWLRDLAAKLDGKAEALMRGETPHPCDFYRAAACLRAAADELDVLRGAPDA